MGEEAVWVKYNVLLAQGSVIASHITPNIPVSTLAVGGFFFLWV